MKYGQGKTMQKTAESGKNCSMPNSRPAAKSHAGKDGIKYTGSNPKK